MKIKLVLLILLGFLSSFDLVQGLSLGLGTNMELGLALGQQGASSFGLVHGLWALKVGVPWYQHIPWNLGSGAHGLDSWAWNLLAWGAGIFLES